MSIPCVTQARVFSPRRHRGIKQKDKQAVLPTISWSWSLPVWIIPMESASSALSVDADNHDIVLHSRIATPLGIEDGDEVMFDLVECGERFTRQVTVIHNHSEEASLLGSALPDFMIHDALSTEIAIKAAVSSKTKKGITTTETTLVFKSGKQVQLPGQDLWGGSSVTNAQPQGRGILHFNGACRNKAAGFGYNISCATFPKDDDDDAATAKGSPTMGPDLVNGYCYCGASGTSNEMQYAGLLEGLEWATRFQFETLWIRGDCAHVIQQVSKASGSNKDDDKALIDDDKDGQHLVEYYYSTKIQALLHKARKDVGTRVIVEQIPQGANVISNVLANLAIDLKENATSCCWANINEQCRGAARGPTKQTK